MVKVNHASLKSKSKQSPSPFNKYAQECTANNDGASRGAKLAESNQSQDEYLLKKNRKKVISIELVMGLVNVPSPLNKSYWNTYRCGGVGLQEGKKMSFRRCKNRFCLDCNGYRTAKLMDGYLPQIEAMKEPMLVTLTRANCSWDGLEEEIKHLNRVFAKIRGLVRTKRNRGQEMYLDGIKKLETTFNLIARTFHPHFHFIVDGEESAYFLLGQWMRLARETSYEAQDVRPLTKGGEKELFKYMTKFWKETGSEDEPNIQAYPPDVLDHIMRAMKYKQVFKPFGRIKKIKDQIQDKDERIVESLHHGFGVWNFDYEAMTWVNEEGITLTPYKPNKRDQKIIKAIKKANSK